MKEKRRIFIVVWLAVVLLLLAASFLVPAADGGEARPFKGLAPEPGDDREEAR